MRNGLIPTGSLPTLFEQFWNDWPRTEQALHLPPLDLWEEGDVLKAALEVPGCAKEDLEVSVHEDVLTIKGARKVVLPESAVVHHRERAGGPFERTVRIGWPVDASKIEASFEHGVLTVSLPKAETAKPRRIEVKVK